MKKPHEEDDFHKRLHGIREDIDYKEIRGILLYHNRNTLHFEQHWHPAVEILYPVEGGYTVQVGTKEFLLAKGDVLIIPPGSLHSYTPPEEGERIVLLIDYGLLRPVEGMDMLMQSLSPALLISPAAYPSLHEKIQEIMEKVICEYDQNAPFAEAMILSHLMELMAVLGRAGVDRVSHTESFPRDQRQEMVARFMKVCSYITEHMTENLTTDELAEVAGFSRFYFSRLFKEFTGLTCHEYLTSQRLIAAEQLLKQADLSITDIALSTGFSTPSGFTRTFKQQKGITPMEYRSLIQKGGDFHA